MSLRPHRALRGAALLPLVCAIAAPLGCDPAPDERPELADAGEDTDEDDEPEYPPATASIDGPSCADYCADFDDVCGDVSAYASIEGCLTACAAWSPRGPGMRGDAVSCRAALLPDADGEGGSCIAAGPNSPMCAAAI